MNLRLQQSAARVEWQQFTWSLTPVTEKPRCSSLSLRHRLPPFAPDGQKTQEDLLDPVKQGGNGLSYWHSFFFFFLRGFFRSFAAVCCNTSRGGGGRARECFISAREREKWEKENIELGLKNRSTGACRDGVTSVIALSLQRGIIIPAVNLALPLYWCHVDHIFFTLLGPTCAMLHLTSWKC